MSRSLLLSVVPLLLTSNVAFAGVVGSDDAPAAATPAAAVEEPASFVQRPGQIDLRLHLDSDILLAYAEIGAAVDVGLIPAGPGTIGLGGEINAGVCVTACAAVGFLTDTSISDHYYSPMARVTYHLNQSTQLTRNPKVDLYGLAMAGIAISTTTITGQGWRASGHGVGPAFGIGAGANYNLRDFWFVGAELRLRYARGTYSYDDNIYGYRQTGSDDTWSQSGLSLMLFGGIRL